MAHRTAVDSLAQNAFCANGGTYRVLCHGARVALALVLATGWLLAAAVPASAAQDWGVSRPGPGARIDGPVELGGFAVASDAENIDAVEVRFATGNGTYGRARSMSHVGGPRTAGRSDWAAGVDPSSSWALDGGTMVNGRYRLETRVHTTSLGVSQAPTDWRGHDVIVSVPPTPVTVGLSQVSPRNVRVTWTQSQAPDFIRYIVERSAADEGSGWVVVAEHRSVGVTDAVDTVPGPGTWRYRVVVTRAGGDGGELRTTSTSREITLTDGAGDPTAPGTPGDGTPGDGTPGDGTPGDGTPGDGTPGDGTPGDGTPGDGTPGEGTPGEGTPGDGDGTPTDEASGERGGGGGRRGSGTAAVPNTGRRVPSISTEVTEARPDAAPPRIAGPGEEVFEETLDFGPLPDTLTETERRVVADAGEFTEGGTLTVFEQELDTRKLLTGFAGMLLMFVTAGHVLRFRDS